MLNNYNEVDILYTLMSYVNVSSSQDMYYTIAHTILTNLEKVPDININDLADLCYTSPATISRFCKDLNCKNFANFKEEVAIALEISRDEIHMDPKEVGMIHKNPQYLVDKIYNETIESLQMVYNSINIHEIDRIYLNFSDPWPKKKHAKRRLTSPTFLPVYQDILKVDGELILKTDNRSLFEYSLISFQQYHMNFHDVCLDLHHSEGYEDNIQTEYERKFSPYGPIYRIVTTFEKEK